MSESRWPIKAAWIGIENDTEKEPEGDLPEPTKKMCVLRGIPGGCIGVIIRSGVVQALGHFCHVKVSVCGKKLWASGAEDRIYDWHSVKLSEIGKVPSGMIPALGWAKDRSTYCLLHGKRIVKVAKAARVGIDNALVDVPEELWQDDWRSLVR